MPPNLGGFFMVRSYYPSECHADYFDFERIEALKPAIEACGISTLSQSPMLGFHKQMEDRKSGSAGMPRPISYAVFCLKKKNTTGRKGTPTGQRAPEGTAAPETACPPPPSSLAAPPLVALALRACSLSLFFFNDTATTEIYTLSLHDALPILF